MNQSSKDYRLKMKEKKYKLMEDITITEITQPEVSELVIEDYSNNPDYKFCVECNTWKIKKDYYSSKQTGKLFKKCKKCHNKWGQQASKQYWEEKKRNKGGSERVDVRPDIYMDEFQKEQVFWLMELLGWTYNDNGVWSKDGIKDKDKNWVNIKKDVKPVLQSFDKSFLKPNERISEAKIILWKNREDIFSMRKEGKYYNEIGKIYNISETTIRKFIKKYYED
jgi:hypothetical protein